MVDSGKEIAAVGSGTDGRGCDYGEGVDAVVLEDLGEVAEGREGAELGMRRNLWLGRMAGWDESATEEDGVLEAIDSEEPAVGVSPDEEELEGVGTHVDCCEEFGGIYGIVSDIDGHFLLRRRSGLLCTQIF